MLKCLCYMQISWSQNSMCRSLKSFRPCFLLLDNWIWKVDFQSSYMLNVTLFNMVFICCRDGYWNIRASVHASVIQIFPPGASNQTTMHQNLTEPVSRPRIIALLLLLVVTLHCNVQLVREGHHDGDPHQLHHSGHVPTLRGHKHLRPKVQNVEGL